ncbi:nuclear transport factor 2 family protein [Nonomuraea sp. NBC_01738]|uniref:nuclear transport factor 2 family protein n=1 Tax=Nonomuraea sp. NBC_01738 TaxID=2976003 RepID=UPI002E0FE2B3|nr:nuclear transport factor 2 family protein [Nonomuraea sp. NBC_01738]
MIDHTVETSKLYREAGEREDVDALVALISPDVVFHSPLTDRATFVGRPEVRQLFEAVFTTLGGLRYHTDLGDDRTRMVAGTARLGRRELEEAALLRLDEQGLIAEITMWIRPLPALTALMSALGPALARAKGRPGVALLVGVAGKPLVAMTETGDKRLVPMVMR